ncbi:MAG: polysaccharide deacetylase family protein [Lentisphaerae bacterium]|nr:polysaccharide deacetylase family protein [Lentisphaerota bacterium]
MRARFFLPTVEVPILLYDRVSDSVSGIYDVSAEDFHAHIEALAADEYKTVSPSRLRAYAIWGIPLPERPFVITFDNAYRSLLSNVKPVLQEQNYSAIINLATTYMAPDPAGRLMLNGEPMLTWSEIKNEMDGDVFIFGGHTRNYVDLERHINPFNEIRASRTDIKRATDFKSSIFSYPFGAFTSKLADDAKRAKIKFAMRYGNEIAKIGAETDFLALPRLRVVGGRHVFNAEVIESISSGVFGKVRITHPAGPSMDMSVLVYDSNLQGEVIKPVARGEIADFDSNKTFEIDLPSDIVFPLIISVFDKSCIVRYFETTVPKISVKRESALGHPPIKLEYEVDIMPVELNLNDEVKTIIQNESLER